MKNKLFVYGIFLDKGNRTRYGMSNPKYATVADYVTYGDYIVEAYYAPKLGLALTGLVVDVDPDYWGMIDALEAYYDRKEVKTTTGEKVWMYVGRSS